ncbi:MAG: aminotransferase class I/II-fold pyridoxal phosphate-dependent enzyme [Gemmatimonadota bacterium]|nr:aminotransferase class I/II-fold pyridoxal phosphate-dependent enzyme [Gemmatimonadota bacterium]MDH5758124.1 aminotransferase class I/II-fold pyridoxal phosphate-dependent enzyme [Gemmatimonadota bacterium]
MDHDTTPALRRSTLGIHAGEGPREPGTPVVPPLVQSATFFWGDPADGELRYSRYLNNPNHLALAKKLAALEGTEAALALASGMAAMSMALLAHVEAGSHIVASRYLYGATQGLLSGELPRRGVTTTFVDPFQPGAWEAAIRPETRVLLMETPTNPSLRILDPRPLAALARSRGLVLVSDCTFASPTNFRGAAHGIDIVVQSATKYLGGHSDLIAGTVAGSKAHVDRIIQVARLYGPALDPHAAFLLDRGIRTLDVRMERHNRSALELARWFQGQAGVSRVIHPGLPDHPDHALASEILEGFGGMLSVVLEGGGEAADRFLSRLRVAMAAPSLGGVETLVSQPRHTSHAGLSVAEREAQGIPDGFVRISVGLEDVEDLKSDFASALG